MISTQIPLDIQLRDSASFDNFIVGKNEELFNKLKRSVSDKSSDGSLLFWGSQGAGKTHLLQAACKAAGDNGFSAVYLPLNDVIHQSTDAFDGLEDLHLICLDDVDLVAGKEDWEQALFHLYNRAFDSGTQLAFTANQPIANLNMALSDLSSRLAWGFVYRVQPLSDEEKIQAMQLRSRRRGFVLTEKVGQYLLRHCPRDSAALFNLLDELDRASLAAQRAITIPFVKNLLASKEKQVEEVL